jgi:hypothetical protein
MSACCTSAVPSICAAASRRTGPVRQPCDRDGRAYRPGRGGQLPQRSGADHRPRPGADRADRRVRSRREHLGQPASPPGQPGPSCGAVLAALLSASTRTIELVTAAACGKTRAQVRLFRNRRVCTGTHVHSRAFVTSLPPHCAAAPGDFAERVLVHHDQGWPRGMGRSWHAHRG